MIKRLHFRERLDAPDASRPIHAPLRWARSRPVDKLPAAARPDARGVVRFCQDIIEATQPYTAAVQAQPWVLHRARTGRASSAVGCARRRFRRDIPVLLDCKVGDVGETARAYARGWFDEFGFDAITVSPYLGEDSLEPPPSRVRRQGCDRPLQNQQSRQRRLPGS